MARKDKPLVLITGANGRIGHALAAALKTRYRLVGLDLEAATRPCPVIRCDLSSDDSVAMALEKLRADHGTEIAAVVHLAAFFDFSGEDSPLYRAVNVEGTRRLVEGLRGFSVGRFVYTSTMLVHRPGVPGERINEDTPLAPGWAYPKSKADAEAALTRSAGEMPYAILRLAGVYDDQVAVPTLAHQIARIYERDLKSWLYAGDLRAGQAFLHTEDMVEAIRLTIDKRDELPADFTALVGEPETLAYEDLQRLIGEEIHGEEDWATIALPKPFAKAGAKVEAEAEPIIPDSIDQGEKPFIRPFMIDMADDHYAVDITRAREALGWAPKHGIAEGIPALVARLKADPLGWYEANGVAAPHWIADAVAHDADPERIRVRHERDYRRTHQQNLWAQFAVIFLGLWLLASPPALGYTQTAMVWSDVLAGIAIAGLGMLSLSWKLALARLGAGLVGLWVLFAPLIFWTPDASAYLNGTVVGALVIGFSAVVRPFPFISPIATQTGPDVPPGWSYSPSSWSQRAPIIALAVLGFFISRYMAAYQLGHIEAVWDPFFDSPAALDPRNGTESIITSDVSEAWPVPDAGLGAVVYLLEILTGLMGSQRRWRTMPWLVLLFGFLIVPLGIVSITFIIIQPIVLGTWCFLCLVAAAAMLIQIPYSVDELVATGDLLRRRHKEGQGFVRVLIFGDTDEGGRRTAEESFERSPRAIWRDVIGGGVGVPWTLGAAALIGVWLMFTRVTLGAEGVMADADHLIGALIVVASVTAMAESARPARLLNLALGGALVIIPFIAGATLVQTAFGIAAGLAVSALSIPRGPIRHTFGTWTRYLI